MSNVPVFSLRSAPLFFQKHTQMFRFRRAQAALSLTPHPSFPAVMFLSPNAMLGRQEAFSISSFAYTAVSTATAQPHFRHSNRPLDRFIALSDGTATPVGTGQKKPLLCLHHSCWGLGLAKKDNKQMNIFSFSLHRIWSYFGGFQGKILIIHI